ncbi:MAG: transcriptional regulator [Deltaproteobacteria bacterium]|nr:transcriptional regulator [Deltaproteobacteria bacterium]
MSETENRIPMLDLAAQHADIKEELLSGFASILDMGHFVLGDSVQAFESDLARLCEVRHGLSCNSGTDALWLALRGLGIGDGDAVLCPAYSFFATAATIVRVGAIPIFCDIDPATLNLDPQDAIRRIETTPNLRAVISVDLFGRACELGELAEICRDRDLPIIQDAAQSIGAVDSQGEKIGKATRIACFSFYPTKNLGALGDAGGLVTSDKDLRDEIARLRVHGEIEPGLFGKIGINSRMDALQAVALSVKLRHLERWTQTRRRLALQYDALFAERGATPGNERISAGRLRLQTPVAACDPARHTYHRYVVRVDAQTRPGLVRALEEEGIASEIYYHRGLHEQPALQAYRPEIPLPETERASRETLALPLFPELGADGVERVIGVVTRTLEAAQV